MKTSLKFFLSLSFSILALTGFSQEFGMASYYADQYHGKKTASGELYDKTKMTCAHKSLLFGSIVRVTRLDNNKSIEVRVNDRGPYIKGRIVDLSGIAAKELGILTIGEAKVKVELLKKKMAAPPVKAPVVVTKKPAPRKEVVLTDKGNTKKDNFNIEKGDVKQPVVKTEMPIVKTTTAPVTTAAPTSYNQVAERVTRKNYSDFDLYSIKVERPVKQGFGVQVSSLLDYKNVMRLVAQLQESNYDEVMISVEQNDAGKTKYKVIVGPFADKISAKNALKKLKRKKHDGFVIMLENLVH